MNKQGTITAILDRVEGISKQDKAWSKQVFVIDTGDQYDNILAFEVFGVEKCDRLTDYNKVGDKVDVGFNIKCNEWQGKYFTSLSAWKIVKVEQQPTTEPQPANVNGNDELPSDDLPF